MYKITLLFPLLLLMSLSTFGQTKTFSGYQPPLKAPFSFSGDFGELRRNHFHTGLDFRTGGRIGVPVCAPKDGMAVRVSVSPTGYGHALYLLHADGHTTVYGHLSRFHPDIENWVIDQQYRLKRFAVDLTVPSGMFSFKKGDVIAWSGDTGSSGGPHLHFEIRDTESEQAQNPLFFLPDIHDKSAPRIASVYLYPLTGNSHVNQSARKVRLEVFTTPQGARLKIQQPIDVFGDIGLGIQSDDDFNGLGLKCGIYSAELYVDQQLLYSFKMDQLAFDQGRYVNSHLDYEELIKNRRWVHRLYLQPGNKLQIYRTDANRGILKMKDGAHQVRIVVADAFHNLTTLTFRLQVKKCDSKVDNHHTYTRMFAFDQPNRFAAEEVKVDMPAGALYDQLGFEYRVLVLQGDFLSKVHQIHYPYVPVHKPYELSVKTVHLPQQLEAKALMVKIDPTGKRSPVGGTFSNGWLTANPREFGNFAVVLDTVPPKIQSLSISDNKILNNKSNIEFKISDNLSGIASYEGTIDGSWVLFEYDAKSGILVYTVDKKRLSLGKNHILQLKVGDERKNYSVYQAKFFL